jgi:hypothetical protein
MDLGILTWLLVAEVKGRWGSQEGLTLNLSWLTCVAIFLLAHDYSGKFVLNHYVKHFVYLHIVL